MMREPDDDYGVQLEPRDGYGTVLCLECGRQVEIMPSHEANAILPSGIPMHPDFVFGAQGTWTGWRDFLGSDQCCDLCGGPEAATPLKKQFEAMTPDEHIAMKAKLMEMAKLNRFGQARPESDTIEGYALAKYTFEDPI